MALGRFLGLLTWFLVVMCVNAQVEKVIPRPSSEIFNVVQFGAVANAQSDSTQAFAKAWEAACRWKGKSRVVIPRGTFMVGPIMFQGPCEGPITFRVEGVIQAHPDLIRSEKWVGFKYVRRLVVSGGGTFDALADLNWFHRYCGQTIRCPQPVPLSIGFDFVTNSRILRITSLNSKSTHINIFGCSDLNITKVRIQSHDESPNTDGIRIGRSKRISISHSAITTGDDCVSLLGGSEDILVSDVLCGPGHGISVGSLGKYAGEADVKRITVRQTTFVGTKNGVRVKTWSAAAGTSFASHLTFEDLVMKGVSNPIIIDQQYCPYPPCYVQESPTQVHIDDVTFRNIRGTTTTKEAVFLRCSHWQPCSNIKLHDINLIYQGQGTERARSVCYNAQGMAFGLQEPPPCL